MLMLFLQSDRSMASQTQVLFSSSSSCNIVKPSSSAFMDRQSSCALLCYFYLHCFFTTLATLQLILFFCLAILIIHMGRGLWHLNTVHTIFLYQQISDYCPTKTTRELQNQSLDFESFPLYNSDCHEFLLKLSEFFVYFWQGHILFKKTRYMALPK